MAPMKPDASERARIVVGRGLEGALHTSRLPAEPLEAKGSTLYTNEAGFLRDLESQLGLPSQELGGERVQVFRARMQQTVRPEHFYARSLERHPLEAATTLLAYRDTLIASGWSGKPVLGGGPRLDALAELEQSASFPQLALGPGRVDRVRAVHRALAKLAQGPGAASDAPSFAPLDLVESRESWSTQWQRVFGLLEALGTEVRETPPFSPRAPLADGSTDLGKLQRLLAKRAIVDELVLRFDGSLRLACAKGADALANACASFVRERPASTLVVGLGETVPLELALARRGLAQSAVQRVTHPAAILAPAARMLVWNLSAEMESEIEPEIFTLEEARALEASGVYLPDSRVAEAAEAEAWRRLVFAAEESLVIALPPTLSGSGTKGPVQEHALVREIVERLGLQSNPEARARLTLGEPGEPS